MRHDLDNLIDYAVSYYENLQKKYGKGRERKTEIKQFEVIQAKQVAIVILSSMSIVRRVLSEQGFGKMSTYLTAQIWTTLLQLLVVEY